MALTAIGIALIVLLALAIPSLRNALFDAVQGETGSVREDIRGLGFGGVLLVIGLAIVHVIVWYPAEILDAAAGYVYGFGVALPLVMACWVFSGILAYEVGRHAARPMLYGFVGEKRFERLEDMMERGGVTFLLIARLVPIVPFSLLGYVCGAAKVPMFRYVWTTAVGYLPITAYFIYLGSQLESFSIEDPIVWIGAIAFIVAIFGVRYLRPQAGEG